MAASTRRTHPVRSLVTLVVLAGVLFGTIAIGAWQGVAQWTPKLALDLEGGTQIILTPKVQGGGQVTQDTINQAITILRQRVDASGVSEAQITSQGGQNIVVAVPGQLSDDQVAEITRSAVMRFRPVMYYAGPQTFDQQLQAYNDKATASPSASPTPSDGASTPAEPTPTDSATPEATPSASPSPLSSADAAAARSQEEQTITAAIQTNYASVLQSDPSIVSDFLDFDCTNKNVLGGFEDTPDKPLITCSQDGSAKYMLAPTAVEGTDIKKAQAGLQQTATGTTTGNWVVNIEFNSDGTKKFGDTTTTLSGYTQPENQFAITLDSLVISAPEVSNPITTGQAEISGNFTEDSAKTLANQLSFGALPLTFDVQSTQQISATLGTDQLEKGLIAGIIGLVLVIVFSLWQYRGLGIVTIASLSVAMIFAYGMLTLLGWLIGYRLSLPGVTGVIVSIGITADSFIVFFERIRDEVRDGRPLPVAVEQGWHRARRTILASDTVNLIAAVVLYFMAVGGVQGFAFTLGLTTMIDLLVVFLFTHPLMTLLIRTKFYGLGHRGSGLDPEHLGRPTVYKGRGRIELPGVDGETQREQQTIAERRAAAGAHSEES